MTSRIRMLPAVLIVAVTLGVDAPRVSQGADPASEKSAEEQQAAVDRLAMMESLARACELSREADSTKPYILEPKPLLRWSNPISGVVDGSLWLWTHEGQPVATVDIFSGNKGQTWNQQWQSLSAGPFECKQHDKLRWTPRQPGLELQPVPGAAPPAKTAAGRLTQMRAIAREFSIEDDFKAQFQGKDFATHELRLLAQPLYRYGGDEQPVKDGALFAFVLATACEALLIVEVGEVDSQPAWRYGLAGQTCYELRAKHGETIVWTQPCWDRAFDKTKPYFAFGPRLSQAEK
ncbi:MAG: hypothetical protein AABP62_22960 [Planctomycetota bacterium]